MPLLQVPLITLGVCCVILIVNLWIGYSLHRYAHYDSERVRLRQRLRHPIRSPQQLEQECDKSDAGRM